MDATLSATLEDYVGVIFRLQKEKKYARVREIARRSQVAKSAVTCALRTLSEKGLVNYEPYEPVTLSTEGSEQAERILLRRHILEDFLANVLGLAPDRAEAAACGMEHAIAPQSMERFGCFLAFVHRNRDGDASWLAKFRGFLHESGNSGGCQDCIAAYMEQMKADASKGIDPKIAPKDRSNAQ